MNKLLFTLSAQKDLVRLREFNQNQQGHNQ